MHSVRRSRSSPEQIAALREKEKTEIEKLKKLEEQLFHYAKLLTASPTKDVAAKAKSITTLITKVNPENYTAWNIRRRAIVVEERPELLQDELSLLERLFMQWPKVYWLWNHRRWVLEQMGDGAPWDREWALVSKLLSLDARNFHGWHYRRHIYNILQTRSDRTKAQHEELELKEFEFTTAKINANFSNYSAWHHRAQLISAEPGSLDPARLKSELDYSRGACLMDPDDQSAWQYYRWLMFSTKCPADLQHEILKAEMAELEQLLSDEPTSKWCAYTLWMVSQQVGEARPDLLARLEKLDPLRKNRYQYHALAECYEL